jgi:dTDP-4-amino-4,6-dideoxygalactose transaminase
VIPRHQLAVAPRITSAALTRAGTSLLSSSTEPLDALAASLRREFGAERCVLTDSGTSALVLALRLLVGKNGTVALPGFGCVDITSAVRYAGVNARLYDIDPLTLSPDLGSVRSVLEQGVQAIVIAHYYGYPADVAGVRELAARRGVAVLEDAAQAAGGALWGSRLGSLGDISILSFGRGKGLFGGRGGALLIHSGGCGNTEAFDSLSSRRGVGDFAAAAAQWAFGRPTIYAIPSSLPWLHLGEMVYHPAREPSGLSTAAATLTSWSLGNEANDRRSRSERADMFRRFTKDIESIRPIRAVEGGESGYLRFAVLDRSGKRRAAPRLGVMGSYPRTLRQQPELQSQLLPDQLATTGADELCRSLFTIPTHFRVTASDLRALCHWLGSVEVESEKRISRPNVLSVDVATQKGSSW